MGQPSGAARVSPKPAAAPETPMPGTTHARLCRQLRLTTSSTTTRRDFPPLRPPACSLCRRHGGQQRHEQVLWPWDHRDAGKLWGNHRRHVIVMNHTSVLRPHPCVIRDTLSFPRNGGSRGAVLQESEFSDSARMWRTWLFAAPAPSMVRGTADVRAVAPQEPTRPQARRDDCCGGYSEALPRSVCDGRSPSGKVQPDGAARQRRPCSHVSWARGHHAQGHTPSRL